MFFSLFNLNDFTLMDRDLENSKFESFDQLLNEFFPFNFWLHFNIY